MRRAARVGSTPTPRTPGPRCRSTWPPHGRWGRASSPGCWNGWARRCEPPRPTAGRRRGTARSRSTACGPSWRQDCGCSPSGDRPGPRGRPRSAASRRSTGSRRASASGAGRRSTSEEHSVITDFSGKVAVITGAGSGIGRALALRCAGAGMHVVAADVEDAALDETVAMVSGDAIAVPTDVSDGAQVDALATRAFDAFGEVHLLCNNAGVFQAGLLWERTLADWTWVLGVNVWGIIHGIRAFVPRMLAQGDEGHVVNTSSLAGLVSNAFSGPYNVSKFAAAALTECLAHDLKATGATIG